MLKRTPLRKISKKKMEKLQKEKEEGTSNEMSLFFQSIWDERKPEERVCYETGKKLIGIPLNIYFHHVLPKHLYPQYKFSKWNIVLVSWATHDQTEWDIDKTPRIKELKEQLLEKHKNDQLSK